MIATAAAKVVIELGNYELDEERQIIRFFRGSVPQAVQVGWELFYARVVKRRYESARRRQKTEPGEGEVLMTRRRFDWYLLAFSPFIIGVAMYSWYVTGEARHWAIVPASVAVWAYFRFRFPRKGIVEKRMSADERRSVWLLTAIFAGILCYFPLHRLLPEAETPLTVVFVIYFVLLFTWLIVTSGRTDRDRKRKELEAADTERASGRLVPEELLTPWSRSCAQESGPESRRGVS